MSEEKKNRMVPKLRFPEFREAEEWQKIKLIDVIDKKTRWSFTGGPFGSNLKSSDYASDGVRIIQLQNIGDGEFIDEYKIYTTKEKADELLSCNIYPGDIILSKMGDPVGRACIIPNAHERYVMCSDGIRLVVDEKRYSKYFLYLLVNAEQFRSLVEKTATGSTRKRIGLDELKQLPFLVPIKLPEQQKIAATLTFLDDLITAQTQKIKALQTHKKGLMQVLFPAEGETVPRVRFSEFVGKGDWEEKKMHEITLSSAFGPRFSSEHYSPDGNVATLRTTDMDTEGNLFLEGMPLAKLRSDDFKSHFLQEGDLLISRSGTIGVTALFPGYRLPVIPGAFLIRFRLNQKLVQEKIIFYYFNSKNGKYKLTSLAAGGVQKNLTGTSVLEISLQLPALTEQQKVADCFSSLDDLITAQIQKFEALKAHKKGLMQQLFPDPNDVEP